MIEWWQHIPEYIDPIAFTVGFFSLHWYALCWLGGLSAVLYVAMRYRKEFCVELSREDVFDLFLLLFVGAFIGGRIGYALLYRPDVFLNNPVGFFLPYHISEGWTGIAGMSFHGGFLGVVGVLVWFARTRSISFLLLVDFISFVAPVGLFFGRIGNFLAGELYGRMTQFPLGMYFPMAPGVSVLRHPSALYEAFLEGVVLFILLLLVKQQQRIVGELGAWFLVGYGIMRFFVEYVREPDSGIELVFDVFTRGQFFSFFLILGGAMLFVWLQRKNCGKIRG